MDGFLARMVGAEVSLYMATSWDLVTLPNKLTKRLTTSPYCTETHVASLLFRMDSAFECLVFALNALGYSFEKPAFHDITTKAGLRKVGPENLGRGKRQVKAYGIYFPAFRRCWRSHAELIKLITEQHDVSKHRAMADIAGTTDLKNAPKGFFEKLGIANDASMQAFVSPMDDIVLLPDPKRPQKGRTPTKLDEQIHVHQLHKQFVEFIDELGRALASDLLGHAG